MLTFRRPLPLLTAGMLLLPTLAFAAGGGMPQLDFKNPLTISQVVWGSLIFVVLYILLSRFALPKVGEVLEARASHIARDLEAARAARDRADAGIAEASEAIAKARSEAQAAVAAALEEAKSAAAAQAAVLNQRLEAQLKGAEAQINQARDQAMGALRQVASDTADAVVTRLTGATPDPRRLSSAIGSVMAARGVQG